ncbi:MAG: pantothenate kinase [Psychrobacter sp.]|jgi:type III pantothenate kinase|uniref:pantothenate kinase n=1 Tax=Psychrobacter submarinus TaxID=154108 RepID=UPI000C4C94CF|nr:pantothenate kinase [Psychrobacter submarinus]MAE39824.1 pantothenate kinase [Psychrobacter sp.]|tara:strand:+ start:451 stop:1188 length:738 start_codon:yes stop_codon:yes gene_type:complete
MLWLDLGNTRLKYWLTDDIGQIVSHNARQHLQAPAELLMGLTDRFERYAPDFIGISSVLGDELNGNVAQTLSRLGIPFEFVNVDSSHALMSSRYDAKQLGCDRWLQMLGAVDRTKRQCVVGCGTAVTIDLIDHAEHLGGYIFPSIYLQRESLFSGTKQITISNGAFDSIAQGVTTQDAVHHGILLSIVGAINEITHRHPNFELIMTGGDAAMIAEHVNRPVRLRDDLLLNGLARYFDYSKKQLVV